MRFSVFVFFLLFVLTMSSCKKEEQAPRPNKPEKVQAHKKGGMIHTSPAVKQTAPPEPTPEVKSLFRPMQTGFEKLVCKSMNLPRELRNWILWKDKTRAKFQKHLARGDKKPTIVHVWQAYCPSCEVDLENLVRFSQSKPNVRIMMILQDRAQDIAKEAPEEWEKARKTGRNMVAEWLTMDGNYPPFWAVPETLLFKRGQLVCRKTGALSDHDWRLLEKHL